MQPTNLLKEIFRSLRLACTLTLPLVFLDNLLSNNSSGIVLTKPAKFHVIKFNGTLKHFLIFCYNCEFVFTF